MKKIGDILASATFAECREQARRGENLDAAVHRALAEAGLGARCRALSLTGGLLTLAVASPAEAAAVRQILPAIVAALNNANEKSESGKGETGGETIMQIRLRIQP